MVEFEKIDSSAWKKEYPRQIVGQIVKIGRDTFKIRLLYYKAGRKMVSEYNDAIKGLYEAEEACNDYVDKLIEELDEDDE
ncbi:hypothetical protein IJ596_08900 [bacterium]|nr:hypothetical protein [bacterium]